MESASQLATICIQKSLKIFKLFLSSLWLSYLARKNVCVGDKGQLLLNILTSVLCQDEVCAMIRRQEENGSKLGEPNWQRAELTSFLSELFYIHIHVCGLQYQTYDVRQQIFQTFSFMFGCSHVSESDLQHQTSDLRQQFFPSGREKIRWQVNLDVCLQIPRRPGKKYTITNRPSDVVSHIHVYISSMDRFRYDN